ncbi:MAG: exodeoxyribonuclease VII large subunit [Bacteroidaceae bacterium]|nr:exodeoxyribonuclease VII large subunit [Bacteroidaceae bacterium]
MVRERLEAGRGSLSLYELNLRVRSVLEETLSEPVWIQAELSSVSTRGPHCYLEFVQKAESGNTFIAKARGQIWASKWALIRPYFEQTTGQPLSPGMQVMVQVEVTFHEIYGYALNVIDINPTYTLGDIARRRQEILRQLEEEGIIDLNKELELPVPVQRIAVISAEGAAGWGDFQHQLLNNEYGLAYQVQLFTAVMQGERVEPTIIAALNQIAAEQDRWDVVVIIRGGGATSDLTGFDTLALAENVAQFPLPVITGIGHERDDTVLDLVSHTRVKTPTAAAEFLIHLGVEQLLRIDNLRTSITDATLQLLHQQMRLERITGRIPSLWELYKTNHLHRLDTAFADLQTLVRTVLDRQRHRLELAIAQLDAADPVRIYRLGYSVVRKEGRAVRDASTLRPDDEVVITMEQGTAKAVVK